MNRLLIAVLAICGVALAGFAFVGGGFMPGIGPMHAQSFRGNGAGMLGNSAGVNMTIEDRAALMQATYNDDSSAALAMLQKYGFNGTINNDTFALRSQVLQAISNKDWTGAVTLQQQLQQTLNQERQQKMAQAAQVRADAYARIANETASGTYVPHGRMGMGRMRGFGNARGGMMWNNSTSTPASVPSNQ